MRVSKLTVSGFRSFTQQVEFDLDADVVLLAGPNGTGKTSLVDALMWGLFGHIPRLAKNDEAIISAYSEDGTAQTSVTLRTGTGQSIVVRRGFDGQRMTLTVSSDSTEWQQTEGEEKLVELLRLRRDGERSARLKQAAFQFTRSNYLQQDVVRQFLDESEAERFEAITELVGSGHATELQKALESSRNAWSRVRTQRASDIKSAESEFRQLSNRINKLPEEGPEIETIEVSWKDWIEACSESGLVETISSFAVDWADAESTTDRITRDLWTHRRNIDNTLRILSDAIHGFERINTSPTADVEKLQVTNDALKKKLEAEETNLDQVRARIRDKRKRLQELQDKQEQLAALAKLALQHLGDTCPVCDQNIEIEKTRERLNGIVSIAANPPEDIDKLEDDAKALAKSVEDLQKRFRESKSKLDSAIQTHSSNANWRDMIVRQLREANLAVDVDGNLESIRQAINEHARRFSAERQTLERLLDRGERLSAEIKNVSEFLARKDLEVAWKESQAKLEKLQKEQEAHTRTYKESTEIIEALRSAAVDLQIAKITEIEPLLRRIYRRMDPHPSFTAVRLITSVVRRKGQTKIVVDDPKRDTVEGQEPTLIFSSSQLNALAVAIFLAFNLGDRQLPISAAILDDPLQSLDDVNLLGLIDVLRQVKQNRQLFITTHDHRFSGLLARKLRPVEEDQRLVEVEFTGWSREGPRVTYSEVVGRSGPLSVLESVA